MKNRVLAALLATTLSAAAIPAFEASASQSVSLYIEKVEIDNSAIGEDRNVAVSLRIEGNEDGFLASEFGIAYDNRLQLTSVVQDEAPGNLFTYVDNPDIDIIWFAGASSNKQAAACSGQQVLLTMNFELPADYTVGDVFYLGYTWNSMDGNTAFWYSDKGDDQIDWVRGHSISGSISIPDPNAPKLAKTSLQLNQGDVTSVAIRNFDGMPIWFSDHNDIADVDLDGTITAIAPGVCTIYCYADTTLLTCEVKVTEEYYYSIIGDSPIVLTDPANEVFIEYPNPQGMVVWKSTRNDIVKVVDGQVFGVKNGSAQIISTSNGITYARQIVVNFPEPETTEPTAEPTEAETVFETDLPPVTDNASRESVLASAPAELKCGDVNLDSKIDILDVVVLTKNLMIGEKLSENARKVADVCQDGAINEADTLALLKYIVKIVESIPIK